MYKVFYKLKRNPFELTPDPSFLFATRKHNEALAALYYGVRRRKGVVALTGEVGTGKTLLVRCLLQILTRANVSFAYVFNSRLSPMEFLQYVAGDFGLPTAGKSKSELLLSLAGYVIARSQKSLTTVLVVDEAHHLSTEVLEEVRLLTNLESTQEKLLQILLIGQPELDEKLDGDNLRQLKQRIALRSHLGPLDLDETGGYIYRRLQLAGSVRPEVIFPMDTILEIHRHSRGFPRLINTLCENGLIHAYAKQAQGVTPEIIEEIAQDFRLNIVHRSPSLDVMSTERAEEVQQAARTLLDLYAHLRQTQPERTDLGTFVRTGKHEPYI
ncbi:MAG: ExeA family protein [Candidatus Sulfotelmatobacter sp.]